MYVARAGRHVDKEIIKLAPVGLLYELLQGIGSHSPAPYRSTCRIYKESYRQHLDTIFLSRYYQIAAFDFVHIQLLVFQSEHLGHGRPENIGVKQAHAVSLGGKGNGHIGGHGRLADASLARRHRYDILHAGKCRGLLHLGRGLPGGSLYFHHGLRGGTVYGGLGRLKQRGFEGVGSFVKNQSETHIVTRYADIVFHHSEFHKVFTRSRVAHRCERFCYQCGI